MSKNQEIFRPVHLDFISPTPAHGTTHHMEITHVKFLKQLVGKKIGVEPEGGSPRVLADAVLRDVWGIYDKVELNDCHPPQVMQGLLSGDIDATFWMHVWETLGGSECASETFWRKRIPKGVTFVNFHL